jgi:hypothetical protein
VSTLSLTFDLAQADLERFAHVLSGHVNAPSVGQDADRWMDSCGAAEYLGMSRAALHKHTAARTIPMHQDSPGGKCWFLKSELDAWRLAT